MSLNGLLRQGLDLMEGLAALPFEVTRQLWDEEGSTTSQVIRQAAYITEGLVTMPFRVAREFLEENPSQQTFARISLNLKENEGETRPAEQGQ